MLNTKYMKFPNNRQFFIAIFTFVFTFIIIFAYFVLLNQTETLKSMRIEIHKDLDYLKNSQTSDRDDLNKQLVLLREELIKYKSQQEGRDQILGLAKINQLQDQVSLVSTPTPTISIPNSIKGIVKLKKNWQTADVFKETKASSKIIGKLVKDKLYFIYEIEQGWFKIEYSVGSQGWIQASLVDEL